MKTTYTLLIYIALLLGFAACQDGNDFGDGYSARLTPGSSSGSSSTSDTYDIDNIKTELKETTNQLICSIKYDTYAVIWEANFQNDACIKCIAKAVFPNADAAKTEYNQIITVEKEYASLFQLNNNVITFNATSEYKGQTKAQVKQEFQEMMNESEEQKTIGTKEEPVNVARTLSDIDKLEDGATTTKYYYVKGTIKTIKTSAEDVAKYKNIDYIISDDGSNELTVFRGRNIDNTDFTDVSQISEGDIVVVYGQLQKYKNTQTGVIIPEVAQGNYIVAITQGTTPPVKTFTVTGNGKTVTFNMKFVEGGTFYMGSDAGDDDESPTHKVTLTKDYYMGETEVTQALWYAVMGLSPTSDGNKWSSTYGIGENYPAYYISYQDCQQFLTKLNQLTGQQFRFPTEAEWEFAAKGGTKSQAYTYAGSGTVGDVAWYKGNSDSQAHEVAGKQANELGLYDMSGNVSEWCYDWYDSYSASAQTDPTGPISGFNRVHRGGSWYYAATYCRCAYRAINSPSTWGDDLGFRLAL